MPTYAVRPVGTHPSPLAERKLAGSLKIEANSDSARLLSGGNRGTLVMVD
jgi:hypothetical protein